MFLPVCDDKPSMSVDCSLPKISTEDTGNTADTKTICADIRFPVVSRCETPFVAILEKDVSVAETPAFFVQINDGKKEYLVRFYDKRFHFRV